VAYDSVLLGYASPNNGFHNETAEQTSKFLSSLLEAFFWNISLETEKKNKYLHQVDKETN